MATGALRLRPIFSARSSPEGSCSARGKCGRTCSASACGERGEYRVLGSLTCRQKIWIINIGEHGGARSIALTSPGEASPGVFAAMEIPAHRRLPEISAKGFSLPLPWLQSFSSCSLDVIPRAHGHRGARLLCARIRDRAPQLGVSYLRLRSRPSSAPPHLGLNPSVAKPARCGRKMLPLPKSPRISLCARRCPWEQRGSVL